MLEKKDNLEIQFLSGNYFDYEIPLDKNYLLKYFKTEIQLHFLKYFLKFSTRDKFIDRTGIYCTDRYLLSLERKYFKIEQLMEEAKKNFDFKLVEKINSGKCKL